MKYLRNIVRILLGMVFIFSGFVKGVDPMGSAIKFTEYFESFHLAWLEPSTLPLAILLSTAELIIGVSLFIGLRMIITSWAALLFMGFFTLLTFYSALFSPVSDCGCFGDALVLTNWQTFYKNIILIVLAIFIFWQRKRFTPYSSAAKEWILVSLFTGFGVMLSVYCYRHLPILDFRPYHIGTHIPSKMIIPEGVETDQYKTVLIYEKNGKTQEFTVDNYPANDSTWKFKDSKSELIKKGYTPPIHGFSITSANNEDLTSQVLSDTSYSFIFISEKAEKVRPELWPVLKAYYQFSEASHHKFYVLTSSLQTDINKIKMEHKLPFDFYFSDQTTLKTIIRSNPGLMVLKDGVVIGLWHYNDFPSTSFFKGNILSQITSFNNHTMEWNRIWSLLLLFGMILIVIYLQSQNGKTN